MARGGGGRGGGRGPLPRDVQVSKALSLLLRHRAEQEGLKMRPGGWVGVGDVLNNRRLKSLHVTFPEIVSIVATNEKQRFSLLPLSSLPDPNSPSASTPTESTAPITADALTAIPNTASPKDFLIRANQGHSIKLEISGLLTPITPANAPKLVVHGTTEDAWRLIVQSGGLKPMGRNHVHFARGVPKVLRTKFGLDEEGGMQKAEGGEEVPTLKAEPDEEKDVISGMRNSSSILVFVDLKKAIEKGVEFWVSENGVVLSGGEGETGVVPVSVFEKVVARREGVGILVKDGEVVGELPKGIGEGGVAGGKGRGGKGRGRGRGGVGRGGAEGGG